MLTTQVHPGENLATIRVSGRLNADELAACRSTLEGVVAERGSLRLLVHYGELDLRHLPPAAVWEDVKNIPLIRHIDRCAIVADQRWLRTLTEVAGHVLPTRLATFDLDEEQEAQAWIADASTR